MSARFIKSRILFAWAFAGLALSLPAHAAEANPADPLARIFRRTDHFMVAGEKTSFTLDRHSLPFVDWTLVQAGFIEYLDADGNKIPLNDEHTLTSIDQVHPKPFGVPRGIRLTTLPPTIGPGLEAVLTPSPDYPWEVNPIVHTLLYDETDQLYKLWYQVPAGIGFATSPDLKTWTRPAKSYGSFEAHNATNLIGVINADAAVAEGALKEVKEARPGASGAFFVDPSAPADARYKCTFLAHVKQPNPEFGAAHKMPVSAMTGPGSTVMFGAVSADGLGWRILLMPLMLHDADTMTVTKWDPALRQYVMYTRLWEFGRRTVARAQTSDFTLWPLPTSIITPRPDQLPTEDYYATGFAFYPQQSMLRMIFMLNYNRAFDGSDIRLFTSRDGLVFHPTPGPSIIPRGDAGTPENGFLVATPSFVRAPDGKLVLFYDAYPRPHKFPRFKFGGKVQKTATWGPDRLVALEAAERGEFDSVELMLDGATIELNQQTLPGGSIKVELRDAQFNPIPGHSFADADALTGDHTVKPVTWKGNANVSALRGKRIYLRFQMERARLFAISAR